MAGIGRSVEAIDLWQFMDPICLRANLAGVRAPAAGRESLRGGNVSCYAQLKRLNARDKSMKKVRLICFCLALGALNGCVTPRQSEQPQVLDKLRAMGVDQKTYAKIANHRVLSY